MVVRRFLRVACLVALAFVPVAGADSSDATPARKKPGTRQRPAQAAAPIPAIPIRPPDPPPPDAGADTPDAATAPRRILRDMAPGVPAPDAGPTVPTEPDPMSDAAAMSAEMRRRRGLLRTCYQKALRTNSQLAGKLVTVMDVDVTGKVVHVDTRQEGMNDPDLAACVVRFIQSWSFPPPMSGALRFSYPLVFLPQEL